MASRFLTTAALTILALSDVAQCRLGSNDADMTTEPGAPRMLVASDTKGFAPKMPEIERPSFGMNLDSIEIAGRKKLSHNVVKTMNASMKEEKLKEYGKGVRALRELAATETGDFTPKMPEIERPSFGMNLDSIEIAGRKKLSHNVVKTMNASMKEEKPKEYGKGVRALRELAGSGTEGFSPKMQEIERPSFGMNIDSIEIAGREKLSHNVEKTMNGSTKEKKPKEYGTP